MSTACHDSIAGQRQQSDVAWLAAGRGGCSGAVLPKHASQLSGARAAAPHGGTQWPQHRRWQPAEKGPADDPDRPFPARRLWPRQLRLARGERRAPSPLLRFYPCERQKTPARPSRQAARRPNAASVEINGLALIASARRCSYLLRPKILQAKNCAISAKDS